MKNKILLLALFAVLSGLSFAQTSTNNWGVGLRMGDPAGLTLKKYMGSNALEINIGRTHRWSGSHWYDDRFHMWYDDEKFGYKEYQYLGYNTSVPVALQVHYLFHRDFTNAGMEGFQWYYGAGGQIRSHRYDFSYRYKVDGEPEWIYVNGQRVHDIDLGIDGVGGIEYTFSNAPFSLFADITLFMEVADDPFEFWFQGGIGGRYNF